MPDIESSEREEAEEAEWLARALLHGAELCVHEKLRK